MIVDAHTHAFPPDVVADRDLLVAEEPVFGELYRAPRAQLAGDDDIMRAMAESGVDRAVIAGFAWLDDDRCRHHNDWLLDAAARSSGRLVAMCCIPCSGPAAAVSEMERCVARGAKGFGELRLVHHHQDLFDLATLDAIAGAAIGLRVPLLLHASEPVGHVYSGKGGGPLDLIWRLLDTHEDLVTILAHMGGGLPFYWFMPEVGAIFDRTYVDTAAVPWLYDGGVYRSLADTIGAERILFGSDYPLRHPSRDLAVLRAANLDDAERAAILGGNAAQLFGLGG